MSNIETDQILTKTDVDVDEGLAAPVEEFEQEPPKSLIDLIKQDQADLANKQWTHIPVPGYKNARLSIRYRLPVDGKELIKISEYVEKTHRSKGAYEKNLQTAMLTMNRLCLGLYAQPDIDDEPKPFDPSGGDDPVKFDERLAEACGWEGVTGNIECILRLFDNQEVVILSHAQALAQWVSVRQPDFSVEFWQGGQ